MALKYTASRVKGVLTAVLPECSRAWRWLWIVNAQMFMWTTSQHDGGDWSITSCGDVQEMVILSAGAVGASGVGLLCHSANGIELHLQLLDEGMLAHLQTSCHFLHALPGLGHSPGCSVYILMAWLSNARFYQNLYPCNLNQSWLFCCYCCCCCGNQVMECTCMYAYNGNWHAEKPPTKTSQVFSPFSVLFVVHVLTPNNQFPIASMKAYVLINVCVCVCVCMCVCACNKTIGMTFCLVCVITASLISSSLLIKLSFHSTQYLIST